MPKHSPDYERNNPRLGYRVPKARRDAFVTKARGKGYSPSEAINLLIEAYVDGQLELVPGTVTVPAWMQPPMEKQQ